MGTGTGTETDAETDTGPGDDPLQACLDLPAAAAANWIPGADVAAQGTSTPERIYAAGEKTWELALTLLELTSPTAHPSVAAAPASMTIALGMTYGRFEGDECGDRIQSVMQFTEAGDALHNTLGAAGAELESRSMPAVTNDEGEVEEDPVAVSLRSSIWGIKDTTAPSGNEAYGARLHSVVSDDLAAINEVMNCVIEEQSQGLLQDFIPETLPASDTDSFEVNVAFLQAPWSSAMESGDSLDFNRDDGSTVTVDAFSGDLVSSRVHEAATFVSVEIPMRGGELRAMLVMPTTDESLTDFVDTLTPAALQGARADAAWTTLELHVPLVDIASPTIDFYEPMAFECPVFTLRTVLHGAAVQMDEVGVKAAAASVDEEWGSGTGEPQAEAVYRFDRSFLFFIYDDATNFVLYSGRYAGEGA